MLAIPPAVVIHLAAVVPALLIGGWVLAARKGTTRHKALGRLWVVLMIVAALSSFAIRDLNADGSMSWIHILSAWTLVSLVCAIWGIRTGRIATHRGFMVGTYAGLLVAAVLALTEGRLAGDALRTLAGH